MRVGWAGCGRSMHSKDAAKKAFTLQTGKELPEERSGFAAFAKGDWLWKALTKSKPLEQACALRRPSRLPARMITLHS